ncbi:L-lysine exporter family protein LysE/ArgO [Jatrophihabitans sp. GAS493]|uniref:LysE/ArgO family amino acid transporter n=1 Tax=Jatrophihabitans sp. GAS493 TaxID=1907575 RepID=UPI000BB89577|nr:LysE/ArgO family amino acid transporter [Jatrophihabitans sp. GAS493]SOD71010.1 L-lysine exporter family protein LysE/ArgO [Jatrophihabitans sp. GAS493]
MTSPALTAPAALAAGLFFGLSLIVAIGAQNTYVLRQGLLRSHVLAVVAICALSDVVLIFAGVGGVGVALHGRAGLLEVVRFLGAGVLLIYAALAIRRLLRGESAPAADQGVVTSLAVVVATSLAFTWLNPAVYLDTIVLLGSVANSHGSQEWWFGLGAMVASIGWFVALGFGARLLIPFFRSPRAWRLLDGFVALVMATTAVRVLLAG